jgi:putative transcriptional regulator
MGMKKVSHNVKCHLRDLMWKNRIASINQLSKDTKISRSTLSSLDNNTFAGVNFDTVERLCHHFECEITDLFTIQK